MAEEKKSTSPATESKPVSSTEATPSSKESSNGKGDAPRNCFSESYRSNFDQIDWSK